MTPAPAELGAVGRDDSGQVVDLTILSDTELLSLWSSAMDEMRRRGLIRSLNNPIADYAERLVADHLGLKLVANSTSGHDAGGPDGSRYQIKARRLATPRTSRQLGMLRNLDQDSFDQMVVVLLGPSFELQELWQLPIDLVRAYAKYRPHVNAHVLHAQGAVLRDPRAVRLA